MAASTAIVAEEPLVLTKASIADGLSLIDRVLDEPSGMPSFAYTKLTLASRGATDLDIGSDALKFVRYLDVAYNKLRDVRPIAKLFPALLAANLSNNSFNSLCDFTAVEALQVLNVAYCQLASFEPQTPAPPPPDAAALERLLRAARKEAASRAKAEERRARAAASRASKRRASPDYNSEEEEQEEDESAEPRAITEEGVLLEMLAAHQAGVQEANEEAAGPEDAALLSQFAAPALVHLIANYNKLASLAGLSDEGLPRLARLEARGNGPLKSLSTIGSLTALRELIAPDCPALADISGLHELPSLRVLVLDRCNIRSVRALLTGAAIEPIPVPEEDDEGADGKSGAEEDDAASEARSTAEPVETAGGLDDPEAATGESGGDGIHFGRWSTKGDTAPWLPAPVESIVEEAGLESDVDDEDAEELRAAATPRLGVPEVESDEDDQDLHAEGDDQGDESESVRAARTAAARRAAFAKALPKPPRPATTANGVHPLGRLRVLSLAGNPIEDVRELNRLRFLRGLTALNMADTPVVDSVGGHEAFVTELLIRCGGRFGQRIRMPDNAQIASGAPAGTVDPQDAGNAGPVELRRQAAGATGEAGPMAPAAFETGRDAALANASVFTFVNGQHVTEEHVQAAREERSTRVAAWREELEQRRATLREADAAQREARRAAAEAERASDSE